MVKTLQHDIDIVSIAHLLATIVQEKIDVKGKDIIGLGQEEIERLIERTKNQKNRDGNRNRRGRSRGGNRGRTGNRNRRGDNKANRRGNSNRDRSKN
jgi:ATP-dependent RNA helicase DeaD